MAGLPHCSWLYLLLVISATAIIVHSQNDEDPVDPCEGGPAPIMTSGQTVKYPETGNYAASKTCKWLITAAPYQKITVTFESVDIDGVSGNCARDLLVFYDAGEVNDNPLHTVCGDSKPDDIESTGPLMYVQFTSLRASPGAPGFEFNVIFSPSSPPGLEGWAIALITLTVLAIVSIIIGLSIVFLPRAL